MYLKWLLLKMINYVDMGSATGLKLGGGPKPLLEVSRSLILIYLKLSKILIHAFKY